FEAAASDLHLGLDLARGPLIRVAWFDLGTGRSGRLMVIVHHLVADGYSWQIILADLMAAYQQLLQGQPVRLPAKTTSYKQWAERLVAYARESEFRHEREYWLAPPLTLVKPLPID